MAAPSSQLFTRAMVEKTMKYFADPRSADERDPQQMKQLLGDFVKFEQVVARGLVTPDARQLAEDFVLYAHDWIAQHHLEPVYASLKK